MGEAEIDIGGMPMPSLEEPRINSAETVLAPIYPSISFEELGRLLRNNGTNGRGTLVVVQQIIVGGGITAYYLRDQFWHWCQTLKDVRDAVRSNLARLQGETLH